jgi:hypothetical protein
LKITWSGEAGIISGLEGRGEQPRGEKGELLVAEDVSTADVVWMLRPKMSVVNQNSKLGYVSESVSEQMNFCIGN